MKSGRQWQHSKSQQEGGMKATNKFREFIIVRINTDWLNGEKIKLLRVVNNNDNEWHNITWKYSESSFKSHFSRFAQNWAKLSNNLVTLSFTFDFTRKKFYIGTLSSSHCNEILNNRYLTLRIFFLSCSCFVTHWWIIWWHTKLNSTHRAQKFTYQHVTSCDKCRTLRIINNFLLSSSSNIRYRKTFSSSFIESFDIEWKMTRNRFVHIQVIIHVDQRKSDTQ